MVSDNSPFQFGAGAGPLGGGGSKGRKMAGFMAPKSEVPDPLADVPVTGNVEVDAAVELDALAQGFRDRRKAEEKRFKNATDSEYWFAVCFSTREDKEKFVKAVGNPKTLGDKYIDGYKLAAALGLDLDLD